MPLLGQSLWVGASFPCPGWTFSKRFETDMLGQINQYLSQFGRAHRGKNAPFGLRDRNHHAGIGRSDFVGHVVERDLLVDLLLAIRPAVLPTPPPVHCRPPRPDKTQTTP